MKNLFFLNNYSLLIFILYFNIFRSIKSDPKVIGTKTIRVKKPATFSGKRYFNVTCQDTTTSSCLSIKQKNPSASSGVYNIVVETLNIQVWCDMVSNGGGYTFFLNDANLVKLTQRTLDLLFTDKTHYLLALKKSIVQNYCIVTQLDPYSDILFQNIFCSASISFPTSYYLPHNDADLGPPYLYWPVMTDEQASKYTEHGIKLNGKKSSWINNVYPTVKAGYMALFPNSTGASTIYFDVNFSMTSSVIGNCDSKLGMKMPSEGFFFLEIHFSGGMYSQTDGRMDALGVLAANIGFK